MQSRQLLLGISYTIARGMIHPLLESRRVLYPLTPLTKPMIVIKAGRFIESAKAAASHTGSLTGEDMVYDAAFKRAGVVRVEEIADLFNCAEALGRQPLPRGQNLAIITNAGGPAVMAADALITRGGKLAKLSPGTIETLNHVLPP